MAQVLREHRDTLVSVMETFVHDPLCEWTQRKHQRSSAEETDNPQAKDALATLEGMAPNCTPCNFFKSLRMQLETARTMPSAVLLIRAVVQWLCCIRCVMQ